MSSSRIAPGDLADERVRTPAGDGPAAQSERGRRSSPWTWRWRDRLVLALRLDGRARPVRDRRGDRPLHGLSRDPVPAPGPAVHAAGDRQSQSQTGGILDPLLGTALLTLIGIALAFPLAVSSAVWIAEYGRPSWLARVVESSIEIVAGHARHRDRAVRPGDLPARPVRTAVVPRRRRRRVRALVHRGRAR